MYLACFFLDFQFCASLANTIICSRVFVICSIFIYCALCLSQIFLVLVFLNAKSAFRGLPGNLFKPLMQRLRLHLGETSAVVQRRDV